MRLPTRQDGFQNRDKVYWSLVCYTAVISVVTQHSSRATGFILGTLPHILLKNYILTDYIHTKVDGL